MRNPRWPARWAALLTTRARLSFRWTPLLFRWHRWFGYAVALQVAAWVLGGLVFAWLPFQAWVKGKSVVAVPTLTLPPTWAMAAAAAPAARGAPLALQAVATARGAALKLRYADGELWLDAATGAAMPAPDIAAATAFARQLYTGAGQIESVVRLDDVPPRLGLVRELGARRHVWRVRFDDRLRTRIYIDAQGGELLAVRTEAWVVYDFFWRLHVMDYADGEDFNNPWLRGAALLATGLVASGGVLLVLALRRRLRRRAAGRP